MTRTFFFRSAGLVVLGLTFLVPTAQTQQPAKIQPKLEPIAETKLLMEGLAHVNFRGLERLLQQKPVDVQTWTFARGQALLIAETANLLMLRPPRSSGQAVWFERAMDLRSTAQQMAKTAVTQDYDKSKAMLLSLAASCNRCHQAFRVPAEITAFDDKGKAVQ
jgi:hypothetical protein